MSTAPAVRLAPLPGESLGSAVRRLATLQGHPEGFAFGLHRASDRHPNDEVLGRFAAVLGVQPEALVQNTLWPLVSSPPWIASPRLQRSGSLACGCGLTSYWSYLLLVTVCAFCGKPLHDGPASDPAAEAQAMLLAHLMGGEPLSVRFIQLRRLVEVGHPRPETEVYEGPRLCRLWGSPRTIRDFLHWAWPITECVDRTEAEVYRRVLDILGIPDAAAYEAHPLADELQALDRLVLGAGIAPRDLPNCLPMSGINLTRSPIEHRLGHAAAAALTRHLQGHVRGPQTAGSDITNNTVHDPSIGPWVRWFIDDAAGVSALRQLSIRLLDERPCGLHRTRDTLRSLKRLPSEVVARLSVRHLPDARALAAAYVWLDQTRGSLRSSHFQSQVQRVTAFVDLLTAEDRMLLREHGDHYIRLNDALASPPMRSTGAQIEAAS